MTQPIVIHDTPILLIGGGPISRADFAVASALTGPVVAVDGGAVWAHDHGIPIDALIGDMDSITPQVLDQIPSHLCHPIAEQDSTDFDKALRHVQAPLVIAIGFSGGRIDHQMAVFHSLLAHPNRPCLILGGEDLTFLAPPDLTLGLEPGTRVSLFPLGPVQGHSTGLRWPIGGLAFDPLTRIGTSNAALGPVHLTVDRPHMLCVLPRAFIQPVARALATLGDGSRWPARAG
jgi:thiamine pyrophosphokinase